ncbi:MAG: hypothetical protein WCU90_13785, partial [Kiritimatiellia bacterium]
FMVSVLVFADHNGVIISPEVKNRLTGEKLRAEDILQRQIVVRRERVALVIIKLLNHKTHPV